MGIFGKGYSNADPNGNISGRNRRNSSNTTSTASVPVSIFPAPPQGATSGTFLKPNPPAGNLTSSSSVFGRQKSWSDQLADSSLLNGTSATTKLPGTPNTVAYPPVIPVAQGPNAHYPSNNTSNDVKFVHSTMEILENQIKRDDAPKKKRTRTSTEQLRILQKAFQTDPMPNAGARATLSKKLGMSTRAVQVWFQNRRAKEKLDAKRNVMGLSSNSSFTYSKGGNYDSDDEEGVGNEDDEDMNFDDGDSVNTETSSNSTSKSGGEFLNSIKANGMMGRMAFNSSSASANEIPIKAQRSSSTPNGFFQGFPNSSISNQQARLNQMSLGPKPSGSSSYGNSGHFTNFSSNNPLCHLFPGETFISDVNEASVDQLYQDLGGSGTIPSPIDDTCVNFSAQNSTSISSSGSNFFTFGDPFYGGGIIDRTPSVSPVGFGPRSHFYHPIGSSSFDFMIPNSNVTNPNPNVGNEFNSLDSLPSSSLTNNSSNACKGISGGNVYLTSSISGPVPTNATTNTTNRRSFSLPEAHGNLTFQQMQQLENFGLQVFPSPLLSINEEESSSGTNNVTTAFLHPPKAKNALNNNTATSIPSSPDFLIPFSDFLEGEVIR